MSQVDMAQPTLRNRRRHRQIETMRNTASALQITNITKTFGHTVAVKNASLEIPHGQVVALLGKNGAGKTTLVDITLGLQQQDSGTAKLFNVSPRQAIRRSLVGVVHQTGALLGEYTVGQTLKLFAATSALTVLASFASGMFIPLNQMGLILGRAGPLDSVLRPGRHGAMPAIRVGIFRSQMVGELSGVDRSFRGTGYLEPATRHRTLTDLDLCQR